MTPFVYRVIFAEVGILLLLAAAPLPYSFYTFLRGIASIGGGFLMYRAISTGQKAWAIPGATSLILFTAVFGFEFPKETWIFIDIALGLLFLAASYFLGKPLMVASDDEPGKKVLEKDDVVQSRVFFVITLAIAIFFFMFGQGADDSSCPNWVYDGRGGYCSE